MLEHSPEVRDQVFISYRRDDTRGASGRLYDWLRIAFGRERVFRDVDAIGVGLWREKIDRALMRSTVCVAVIGPRWVNPENLSRLHDEGDMVRHELATALAIPDLLLVPTLVEGAEVPLAARLPPPLRPLIERWNARRVTEDGWEDDTRRLIRDISAATGLMAQPDLDTLLRDAGGAQARVAELERTRYLQADQIDGLRRTVDELARKLAEAPAGERHGLAAAFTALARGDSRAAEDAFEREYDQQARTVDQARTTMAEAARHVANLALLRDVAKAAAFYQKALALEPNHAETARLLGHAWLLLGDLSAADTAFRQSLSAALNAKDSWGEMAAHVGRGDVLVAEGDGPGALAAFRRGLAIAEALAARDPVNTQRQRDLSVSHDRIGGVLVAQGDGPGALAAFRQGLAIVEALAARDPVNTEWQRDLTVSQIKIGDVLVAQGDGPGALAAFRQGLAIAEALTARDPANTEWQRDLSVSHERIGSVLVAQGDEPGALAAFRRGLAIREALAARDPANTEWQRDLIVSLVMLGEATGEKTFAGRALDVALGLQQCGVLAPRDGWMIEDLRLRAGR